MSPCVATRYGKHLSQRDEPFHPVVRDEQYPQDIALQTADKKVTGLGNLPTSGGTLFRPSAKSYRRRVFSFLGCSIRRTVLALGFLAKSAIA